MLPASLESGNYSAFELEVNELRTYQGQLDVFVINDQGTITAMTFGGGANALVTELLGDAGTISSDSPRRSSPTRFTTTGAAARRCCTSSRAATMSATSNSRSPWSPASSGAGRTA